jgi:glycerophosphoryl diester phosphodiesterase
MDISTSLRLKRGIALKPYLSPAGFKILAHRGSTEGGASENTLEAFRFAIDSGLKFLETDVQATKDHVAVLFHDQNLKRLAGIDSKVSDYTFADLQRIVLLGGGKIPSLEQALRRFPQAKFNLDIKTSAAVLPTVEAIGHAESEDRVLISSFSRNRRLRALGMISNLSTSADATTILKIWLAHRLGLKSWCMRLLAEVDALQMPTQFGFIRLDNPDFVKVVKSTGVEIHYWTINDFDEATRLANLGADGIVTDKSKMMFDRFNFSESK